MDLNTTSISALVDLTERMWLPANDMYATGPAKSMFIVDNLANHTGNTKRYTEIDTQTYAAVKEEGADAAKATVQKGYEIDMTARRFAMEIDITKEMRMFNKNQEVVSNLTSLSHFCPQRMELDLTHRLSFCTATSYADRDGVTIATVVGDTKALVSSTHTVRGSSETFSNGITGNPIFSKGGLEVAELQANTQIVSQYNEKREMNFNVIYTSNDPTTVNAVKQFLMSTTDVDQNNSGVVNVYKGKYQHVILPHLASDKDGAYDSTKAKYWGIAATGQGAKGWQAYLGIWEAPHLKTPPEEDFHNDDLSFGTRCTYGIVTVSPKGLIHSTGLGV